MPYEVVRNEIKTGDILACEGTAFYSKIIRKWGGFRKWVWTGRWIEDKFTHVGIAIWIRFPHENNPDRLCILEAHAMKGVRLNPLSQVVAQYRDAKGAVHWLPITDVKIAGDCVATSALMNWAKAYPSIRQFIVSGLSPLQWWKKRKGESVDLDDETFHCSELAARSLIDAGYHTDVDPAVTTPQMLTEFQCLGSPTQL